MQISEIIVCAPAWQLRLVFFLRYFLSVTFHVSLTLVFRLFVSPWLNDYFIYYNVFGLCKVFGTWIFRDHNLKHLPVTGMPSYHPQGGSMSQVVHGAETRVCIPSCYWLYNCDLLRVTPFTFCLFFRVTVMWWLELRPLGPTLLSTLLFRLPYMWSNDAVLM